MRSLTTILILFGCLLFASPFSAAGQGRSARKVVARFGGECEGSSIRYSSKIKAMIKRSIERSDRPCDSVECYKAFTFDLNGDGTKEYFVRLSCGATGNCQWGIYSDHPARSLGTFTAWFVFVHKRNGSWSKLSTYTREGGDQGAIGTVVNRHGRYIEVPSRTEKGYYGNWQRYLTRMGMPICH